MGRLLVGQELFSDREEPSMEVKAPFTEG